MTAVGRPLASGAAPRPPLGARSWPRRSAAALTGTTWMWPGGVLFTVARVPSFLEPHWYTDEAGYATTARALTGGATLYSQIWSNKPPLHLWTVAVPVALFGGSEVGLHALTFLAGLGALAAVAYAAARTLGRARGTLAVGVAGLLLGLPLLDAELTIPDSLLIAPTAWAGALIVTRLHAGGGARGGWAAWPFGAGILAAAGIAYQQTAIADAAVFGLILLAAPTARGRDVLAYVVTVAVATAAWVVPSVLAAGQGTVAFALGGFYVAYTQSVLPGSTAGLVLHASLVTSAVVLLVAASVLLRRRPVARWAYAVWAGATLLVAGAAQQPYAHFLLPAVAPVALAAAALPRPRLRMPRRPALDRRAAAGALTCTVGLVIAAGTARSAGLDWVPAAASQNGNAQRTLSDYYLGTLRVVAGRESLTAWRDGFDDRVDADSSVARWLRDRGLTGHRAVVWSSDAWPYLDSDLTLLLRTAPIYNDEVLLGVGGPVAAEVRRLAPEVIVTADDALQYFPEIGAVLQVGYRQVVAFGPDAVWLRADLPGAAG